MELVETDIVKVYRNCPAGTTGSGNMKNRECKEGEVVKRLFKEAKRLIIIGLLMAVGGCASVVEMPVPAEGIETGAPKKAVAVFHNAEMQGAESVAPRTYLKTKQAFLSLKAVIGREPGNDQVVQEATRRFTFEAEHLLHITQEVNELRSLQSEAMENVVLSAEYRLLAISDALKQPDPRQQKLYDQTVVIANAANKLVSSLGKTETDAISKRHINKNELDAAYTKNKQLELQLESMKKNNDQLKLDQKPLKKRIESLERFVLELNEKNVGLENRVRELKDKLNQQKPSTGSPAG